MTKARVFATEREAQEHITTLGAKKVYLERTEAIIPNPGRAAVRLRAKGVLTEEPIKVIPLKDGTFAVPVPLVVETVRERDARNVDYDRVEKREDTDPSAVAVDPKAIGGKR